jgi:hypothetical protein
MANQVYTYTNGYDQERLTEILLGRVSFQSDEAAESGRYFDDGSFHALATEANWKATHPTAALTGDSLTAAKQAFTLAAVNRSLQAVLCDLTPIENTMLFDVYPHTHPLYTPEQEYNGYEISVSPDDDKTVQIKSVLLHLNMDADITLYLWQTGNATPIWKKTVKAKGNSYSKHDLENCYLVYSKLKTNGFFFGYKKSELPAGCKVHMDQVPRWNRTCVFAAIPASSSAMPYTTESMHWPSSGMGLNLEIASMYDYTEKIVFQPWLFDELIGLAGACAIVEQIIYCVRSNEKERLLKDDMKQVAAQFDLMGAMPINDSPTMLGLRSKFASKAKAIKNMFRRKTGIIVNVANDCN